MNSILLHGDDRAPTKNELRIAALDEYAILDTAPEAEFNDIVQLASEICGTSTSLISLVSDDRQWFKARVGFDPCETPIEQSVCAHALAQPGLLIIPDLTKDPRTQHNTLVTGEPHIRFYTGARLETSDGVAVGTLCVIDGELRPEGLTERQKASLLRLAPQVMSQLELRKAISQRDAAGRRVRDADSRYRQIVDSATDYGIITMTLAGDVTSWSIGAEEIMGWSEAEMLGMPSNVFFTDEDVAAGVPDAEMRDAREVGRTPDDRWHMRKDGSRFLASGEMMPLKSALGVHTGYLKILRDQTQEIQKNKRIACADERLEIALAASGVIGLWDWSINTGLLHGDTNFARMYGLDIERTLQGLTMEEYQEFVVPEDILGLRQAIRNTFDRGDDFLVEYRLAIPGRSLRWVECRGGLVYRPNGKAERFSGSAIDISSRKTAEARTTLLAAIVEQSRDFIGVARLDGQIMSVNAAGRHMVGLTEVESAIGTSIEDYFDAIQWPLIVETVFPAVDRDGSWRGELRFKHFQTGEPIPVIYDVIALRDADGAVVAYATVTRDIREQKDAESRQNILNQELAHRMKNTLALVQAIAMQTLKGVSEKNAVAALTDRLQAISSAHNVLLQQSWVAAKLDEVVVAVLGTFHMEDRFTISGPETDLGPRATLSLSLLLHELATNAIKYGALSTEEGRVAVTWKRSGIGESEELSLSWKEQGGPTPVPPSRRGFGSRLISMGLIGTGGAQLDYPQDGFEGVFTAPLVQVQQS